MQPTLTKKTLRLLWLTINTKEDKEEVKKDESQKKKK
jgi:hypothetical protein